MAYNESFPADDEYLADFPSGAREQFRALKEDAIVNAGTINGLNTGNNKGDIPINNGKKNENLNAALLDGKSSNDFAAKDHEHDTVTTDKNGFMLNTDKKKLDEIENNAEVNQDAFAMIKVGDVTIQADDKQDTIEFLAGDNIDIIANAENDRITFSITEKIESAVNADIAKKANVAEKDINEQKIEETYIKNIELQEKNIIVTKGNDSNFECNIGSVIDDSLDNHNNDENAHKSLIDELKSIMSNSGINILLRNKSYNVGDIAYSAKITSTTHLASKLYLECIQEGTTGTEDITLSNINLNDEITDGTAKFKVYDVGLQSLPVGSIYQSTIATSPENLFGGTWEAMPAGRVLLAQGKSSWGTTYNAGSTGGEATHQLTVGELPTVTPEGAIALNVWANDTVAIVNGGHTFSGSSDRFDYRKPSISGTASFTGKPFGSNQAHNNIQPYISCYIWKRVS